MFIYEYIHYFLLSMITLDQTQKILHMIIIFEMLFSKIRAAEKQSVERLVTGWTTGGKGGGGVGVRVQVE
jgi:hypothetical protein